ncbi:hypothetical protein GCM10027446_08550 [Angustibacter peucedani]
MLRYTRGVSLFIVPFLLGAWVILYVFPRRTAQLWAWPIAARMSSMVLASAYLGGAYFFLRVLRERRWHSIGTGFVAVTVFASLLGVATVVHWDRFSHGHLTFWLWAALYFTAPFLVLGAWVANRRYAAPVSASDVVLGPVARSVVGGVGLLALAQGAAMFVRPSAFVPLWPWALTPLTARVVAATLCLGGAGVGAWRDPRWTALRRMVEVEVVMVALMLVAAVRASDELLPGRALAWPLLVGIVLVLLGSCGLWVRYERPLRRVAAA